MSTPTPPNKGIVPSQPNAPVPTTNAITSVKSSVNNDVEIHGSITFKGDLTFGGQLSGGGIKGPRLVITEDATINGNVECDTMTLHGKINGNVDVATKCELKESAQLVGDLTSARLLMGDGATFIGKARINSAGKNVPPAAK